MATVKVKFDKVSVFAEKEGICPACGTKAKRKKEFWATINPFNKNPNGSIKTGGDIRPQLVERAEAWKAEPCYHAKCEGAVKENL